MLWCVTSLFNPAGYGSLVRNHAKFAAQLRRQGVPLLTIEAAFNNDPFCLSGDDVVHVRSNSVMWLKERLINHAETLLPPECDAIAWVDCDLLFSNENWAADAEKKLEDSDVIQLFKRVFYLPPGCDRYEGRQENVFDGIVAQSKGRRWIEQREDGDLRFAAPGFAWAATRREFRRWGGLYDLAIAGNGDCVLADSLLGSWSLHGFHRRFSESSKSHIANYAFGVIDKPPRVDYLPIDVFHLWHGTIKNRRYIQRHKVLIENEFDPEKDVRQSGPVLEWVTNKPEMHKGLRDYFYSRQEDSV